MTLHHVTHDGRHVTDQDIARSAASALQGSHGENGSALMLWRELDVETSEITLECWRWACWAYAGWVATAWRDAGLLHYGCRHPDCADRRDELDEIRAWPMPSREDRMDVAAIAAE